MKAAMSWTVGVEESKDLPLSATSTLSNMPLLLVIFLSVFPISAVIALLLTSIAEIRNMSYNNYVRSS